MSGTTEAFARVKIDGLLKDPGWNLSDGSTVLFEHALPDGTQADRARSPRMAELEFVAAPGEENLEDRMVLLTERGGGAPAEHEISLRLLRHYASSVYHQQYHDTDIVTVRVEGDGQE